MPEIGGRSSDDDLIIIRDDDGVAYAVPRREMERFRMTPERHARVTAQLRAQAASAGLPQHALGDALVYEVDTADLAPYRLNKEAWTRLDAALHGEGSEVRGFESGRQAPSWVAVARAGHAAPSSHVHTYPAWYWSPADGDGGQSSRANVSA